MQVITWLVLIDKMELGPYLLPEMQGPPDIMTFGLPPFPRFLWPGSDISCSTILNCLNRTSCQKEPLFCDNDSVYDEMWNCLFSVLNEDSNIIATPGKFFHSPDGSQSLEERTPDFQQQSISFTPYTSSPFSGNNSLALFCSMWTEWFLFWNYC